MEGMIVIIAVFTYVLGLMIGQESGERMIKNKILWNIYDYKDKTVREMFDYILHLTDNDWAKR